MDKILYNAMLSQIQKQINNEKDGILEFLKKDRENQNINIKVEIPKLLEIIEYYKTVEIEEINKNLIICCNGNPYTVLNIILLAIIKNCNIKINTNNIMIGVNKYILEIVLDIIKAHNLNVNVEFINNIKDEKIICIDRMNTYLSNKKNANLISYKGIDIYLESDKYEDLFEKIYEYACDQNIDIDIFNDESIESMIQYGKNKTKIILTDNKKTIEKYKDDDIYVNENPFKNDKNIFDKEMIRQIFKV